MFEYFYNEILRKTIVAFGSLFNNIHIKHTNDSNDAVSYFKVPLAYAPTQKFLARLEQSPNLNKPVQITLPRMSFEFVGLTYDPSRKVTTTQTFLTSTVDGGSAKKVYMPVPYNMAFELSIFTKLNEDMLEIVEQILPYFQPGYTLSINLVKEIGEKRDIPVVLESISMQDDYEGNFDTRRALIYTLRFNAKTYLFGPVPSADLSKDIIKKVSIGYIGGERTSNPNRDLTYSVAPRALQSYTDNTIAVLSEDIDESATRITVSDSSGIEQFDYLTIDNEEVYVTKIENSNTIFVSRSMDETAASSHVSGTEIKKITKEDSALIGIEDSFGFEIL